MILDIVEHYLQLKQDGLPDVEVFEKIDAYRPNAGDPPANLELSLRSFVVHRLNLEDPLYRALGPKLLDKVLSMATGNTSWVRHLNYTPAPLGIPRLPKQRVTISED